MQLERDCLLFELSCHDQFRIPSDSTRFPPQLHGDSGRLQREPLHRILKHFVKLPTEKVDKLFYSLDTGNRGAITFEDFYQATEHDADFKRLFEPNRNFRQK